MNSRNSSYLLIVPALLFGLFSCNNAPVERESGSDETAKNSMLVADKNNGSITLSNGFGAYVVADDIGKARHMAVRDNGDIYVKLRQPEKGGGLLALRDTTGDGRADIKTYFGPEVEGTGIAIHNDYLYFSSDTIVYRSPLSEGELLPTAKPEVVVSGFLPQGQHATKSFTISEQGDLFVNVGAPSNACQEQMRTPGSPGQDPCPQLDRQAGIWKFDANTPGQTQQADGQRYATGIRNAVAVEWNNNVSTLYALQHGRDQLNTLYPELFTDEQSAELPAEEFLRIEEGDDFGWPFCYYDPQQNTKVLAPEYGGDGQEVGRCADAKDPIMAFPAHWAPNDLVFYEGDMFPEQYRNGAFIAFHGSWNRAPMPQKGYLIAFVPMENGMPSGEYERFADEFAGEGGEIESPSDAEFRPTGLATGPDGSVYISDDVSGRIWRVFYDQDNELAMR
jgi:glucose/arabinose dehydrogenase